MVQGPGWRREQHSFDTLPLYWREGTVLALGHEGKAGDSFDYDWFVGTGEVRQYGSKPGDEAVLVDNKGQRVGKLVIGDASQVSGTEVLSKNWTY
jgi:hypothetical protein